MSRTSRRLRPPGESAHAGRRKEGWRMKYMIMMFGDQNTMYEVKSPEWIRNMHGFMHDLDKELRETGLYVDGQGLVDPSEAKTIRFENGAPVATDGPFAEAKESLAGYWLIDATEEQALEIGSRIVGFIQEPIEVRRVGDAPPEV
jgi:hypothetical protein